MKTIFHDKESGTRLEMEGTFVNSKARLIDEEGNVLIESEGSYLQILEMFNQLSGEETEQLFEDTVEDEEVLTNTDFRDARVKILEDIEDEYGDIIDKGTVTRDVAILAGEDLLIKGVFVRPKDFKKLEILTDEQKDIERDELFVVNNDDTGYYLGFEKGQIVKFLLYNEGGLPLLFRDSKGIEQSMEHEDVTRLGNQEGNKLRFNFCYENDILFTEDTSLEGTEVNLNKESPWIEDDGSLVIDTDCDDGIPYVKSKKSGYGAFITLENLKIRKEDIPSFEIGETVEVKEGKDYSGAVGYAILADIRYDEIILQGFNKYGEFSNTWHNNIINIKKVDK